MITLENINIIAEKLASVKRIVLKHCPTKQSLLDNIESETSVGLLVTGFVESLGKDEEQQNLADFITILYGED